MYKDIIGLANCYGCGVCSAVCPVGIIRFAPDDDGFYRPSVTEGDKCIECGYCNRSCAALTRDAAVGNTAVAIFSGYSDDDAARLTSSSGGVGYELAKKWVDEGAVFCGVRYDPQKRRAEHYVAHTPAEIGQSKGSKYMQSFSPDGLRQALTHKGKGLITGLPCQIASVRNYLRLRGIEDRFLLADLFCYGVPTQNLWDKYVSENEETLGRADNVVFRDKEGGWHDSYRIRGTRGGETVYLSEREDLYFKFFLRRYVQSLPCYSCPFRRQNSAADIRLGDMWGDKYAADDKGVSVIAAMTEKGWAALQCIEAVSLHPETAESAIEGQMEKEQPVPAYRGRLLRELAGTRTLAEIDKKYRSRLYLWRLGFRVKRRWRKLWNDRKK